MSIKKSKDLDSSGCRVDAKRGSQWEDLMRKFSEAHREECKTVSLDIPRVTRSAKPFPTGSQYEGTWDVLGMSGYGVYKFPNGVVYEGEFIDGVFNGQGDLKYPSGAILCGTWSKGQLIDRTLIFADGLEYSESNWMYCRMPDRRYTIEYKNGIQPSGKSYITAEQPTREIPPGYYDTEDGFYDPKTKVVFSVDDLNAIIRSPSVREQKWIVENCRTSPEEPLGPRKELYEEWQDPKIYIPIPPSPASESRGTSTSTRQSNIEPDRDTLNEEVCVYPWRSRQSSSRWNQRAFIKFDMNGD